MTERSNLYLLVEKQLGSSLEEFVSERRPGQSWRSIASELQRHIGGVRLSHEILRQWFPDEDVDAPASADTPSAAA